MHKVYNISMPTKKWYCQNKPCREEIPLARVLAAESRGKQPMYHSLECKHRAMAKRAYRARKAKGELSNA